MLKKYALPVAIFYSILLAVASLVHLGDMPKMDIDSGDKIFHALAYFILTLLWFNTFFLGEGLLKSKALIYASILSFVFGIIIELLQGGLTQTRTLDKYDIVANLIGIFCTVIVVQVYFRKQVKNH